MSLVTSTRTSTRAVALGSAPAVGWTLRAVDLLRLALGLLVVANLGRLPVLDTGGRDAPILLNDVVVGLALAGSALAMLAGRRVLVDRIVIAGLAFAAVGAVSAVIASRTYGLTRFELLVSLAYLARWLFYFAIYLAVINVARPSDAIPLRVTFERAVLVFAMFGIVQAVLLPNFAQIVYPDSRVVHDWDAQAHRLVSTLLDPNFAGMLILMALLLQLARIAAGLTVASWQPMVLFVALLLTVSRSSVLALVAGGAVVIAVRGVSLRILRAGAIAAALTIVALPGLLAFANAYNKLTIDDSALGRVVMWLRGLEVVQRHPVMGIGFNTFGFVQERFGWERMGANTYSIEGGLLFVAVMTGVVGLAFYIWMLRSALQRCRAVWRAPGIDAEYWSLAVGTAAITVALLVHACFTNSLFLPYLMEPLWVLWGLVSVVARSRHA